MYHCKQQVIRRNIDKPWIFFTSYNESLEASACATHIAIKSSSTNSKVLFGLIVFVGYSKQYEALITTP
jgi:hypothetical protein